MIVSFFLENSVQHPRGDNTYIPIYPCTVTQSLFKGVILSCYINIYKSTSAFLQPFTSHKHVNLFHLYSPSHVTWTRRQHQCEPPYVTRDLSGRFPSQHLDLRKNTANVSYSPLRSTVPHVVRQITSLMADNLYSHIQYPALQSPDNVSQLTSEARSGFTLLKTIKMCSCRIIRIDFPKTKSEKNSLVQPVLVPVCWFVDRSQPGLRDLRGLRSLRDLRWHLSEEVSYLSWSIFSVGSSTELFSLWEQW